MFDPDRMGNRTADLHTHSCFSDGKNTPVEMVEAALAQGLKLLGFSEHSYLDFEDEDCIRRERIPEYLATIHALQKKYAGQIEILCGIEQDFLSTYPTGEFDYVIGSVHFLVKDGVRCAVDYSPEKMVQAVEEHFGGDYIAFAEAYFDTVAELYEKTRCDIVGHFDLVTKYNEQLPLIDTKDPRYIAAWQRAADRLLKAGCLFEINTGAISRGYRTTPYPAADIRDYITSRGGKFLPASDSHSAATLCFAFKKWS